MELKVSAGTSILSNLNEKLTLNNFMHPPKVILLAQFDLRFGTICVLFIFLFRGNTTALL
jgi:hypothetical protein